MTVYAVENTTPYWAGRDGLPLQGGKVYFGTPGQNPPTSQVSVYWDSAATQPVFQPVLISNGKTVRSDGTPARVYAPADCSVLVQDAGGAQVSYVPTSQGSLLSSIRTTTAVDTFSGTGSSATYTLSVTPNSKNDTTVYIAGAYQPKSSYTLVGNQLTISAAAGVNNIEVTSVVVLDYATITAAAVAAASASVTKAANWAQQTGSDVTGEAAGSRSAKSWSQDDLHGATYGGSAKDWAQSASLPDGTSKSAKSYASDAADSSTATEALFALSFLGVS